MKKIIFEGIHHLFHYLILIIIIFGGLTVFFLFRAYPMIQLLVGIVIAIAYVLWGIFHHLIDGDLSVKIVIEYLAVAIFAIIILWNLLVL